MALQDLIGELIQQGMAGQTQTRLRSGAGASAGGMEALRDALMGRGAGAGVPGRAAAPQGGGLEDLLGAVLGGGPASAPGAERRADAGRGAPPAGGGLEDLLGAILGGGGAQGRSAPQGGGMGGGLGDLLGAVLGGAGGAPQGRPAGGGSGGAMGDLLGSLLGGSRGVAGGGAMAILASLAMGALKSYMASGGQTAAAAVSPEQARALVSPDAERAILTAMIEAAKADGKLDKREIGKILAKAGEDGLSAEEKAFIDAALTRPIDLRGLAAQAGSAAMAAQIYAASLLAIDVDTPAETAYLRDLAAALRLDPRAVAEIHRMTGAPAV